MFRQDYDWHGKVNMNDLILFLKELLRPKEEAHTFLQVLTISSSSSGNELIQAAGQGCCLLIVIS